MSPFSMHRLPKIRPLFLRLLGLIYFCAFVSAAVQVKGLIGAHGIAPAVDFLSSLQSAFGAKAYLLLPSFAWISASDHALLFLAWGGAGLSLGLLCGIAPFFFALFSWLFWLSLVGVGDVFFGYQWESLLLETGFLALFIAPFSRKGKPLTQLGPWLYRWLLFRLLFASGCVKLLSGDPTWSDLTALHFHWETQPLPTWIAWYLEQLPMAFQKLACGATFFVELLVPLFFFAPRRLRRAAFWWQALLQFLILLSGNYAYFNWLTLLLLLWLLDDTPWPAQLKVGDLLAIMMGILGLVGFVRGLGIPTGPVEAIYAPLERYRIVANYGLFAVMTTERDELEIEGSRDGKNWLEYELPWKPSDPMRRPGFVAPHQPRLDWQMWFAALGTYRDQSWIKGLYFRLLKGEPSVTALFRVNPFPESPPKYLRILRYEYHFTTWGEKGWWHRKLKGPYGPTVSLDN